MARRSPRLEITADDIAAARPNDNARSPFMLAARRQFPDADVTAGSYGLGFTHHCERCCCSSSYAPSRRARRFLDRFERGLLVEPATFEFHFSLQALLVCQCNAQKAARQLEAEERAAIHRMADVVGEIRRLIEEPARSALQDAFPDVQLGEPDS